MSVCVLDRIDSDTLRRWLKASGLWTGIRVARCHRQRRERREAVGALLQFDGSSHAWFEDRGPLWCLMVAIDDASGCIFMRFATSDNGHEVKVSRGTPLAPLEIEDRWIDSQVLKLPQKEQTCFKSTYPSNMTFLLSTRDDTPNRLQLPSFLSILSLFQPANPPKTKTPTLWAGALSCSKVIV
jgi:hypothetical protein